MNKADEATERFVNAVKRIEQKANVSAYVVIDPTDVERNGRIVISYPRDGAGRLTAIAWLPGNGRETIRHYGWANGGGYVKKTAAMGGAAYVAPNGVPGRLVDQGYDFAHQLREAGFIVIQAV